MKHTRQTTDTTDRQGGKPVADAVLASIVSSAMDGIIAIDARQRIVLFNDAAEKMFGRAAKEMLGQPIDLLLPERFRVTHPRLVEAFGQSNVTRRTMGNLGAIYGLRATGEEFPLEAAISQATVAGRRILAVVLRDITERRRVEEALHASTALVTSIVESSNDAIIGKTLDGTIISWNAGAEALFGYSEAEALGKSMLMLFPAERLAEEAEILARIARGERVAHLETERICKDGRRISVSITTSPLRNSSGSIIGASKIARDISEQKREREKVLRLSRIHSMLSSINSLIVRSRERAHLLESACRIAVEQGNFGAAWIGLLDENSSDLRTVAWAGLDIARLADDERTLTDCVRRGVGLVGRAIADKQPAFSNDLAAEPKGSMTVRMRVSLDQGFRSLVALPLLVGQKAIGAVQLFARECGVIDESELRLLTEIAGDISFALEHIEQEEKLQDLVHHDPLTGLVNRLRLFDRLEQAIRSARDNGYKLALVSGDIKDFRQINGNWGRQAGDLVLRELGKRLKRLSPEPENVARINSDHYAGIVSSLKSAADLASLMERSLAGPLSEPYHIGGTEIRVFTRAGIAIFPDDAADAESLFRNSEAAHRRAKETGQRYLFYEPAMNARVAQTLLLESKLRAAEERQQFLLHYQPIVNAERSSEILGLEALLRWQDPDGGLVYPDSFVPMLEDTELIVKVGYWVMRQALAQRKAWIGGGVQARRIAVNISAVQLRQPDFVERVLEILSTHSGAIDFEITESVLMHSVEDNIQKLQRLRGCGISIAIDDFGIGYSSLSYLARLPINTVKIDRAFVSKMTIDSQSMAVVSAIISLARTLRLKVVAEGVETEEQARFLRLLGCDELQGYLFGKPVAPEEIGRLLANNGPGDLLDG
jgi:PAS domain S-box-containing protein/diguanylate cyclase (GGDEF)-like protein